LPLTWRRTGHALIPAEHFSDSHSWAISPRRSRRAWFRA